MAIRYEAYTWSGRKVKGVLDTNSEEDAYELLERDELIPYRLLPVRRRRTLVEILPSLFTPRPKDLIDFTQQMASLLKSGIPLRTSLAVHRDQTSSLGLKEALRKVIEDVEGGSRFSDAISRHPTVFPDFYARLMGVGEASGGIAFAMEQLAHLLERRKTVREKVRAALVYPGITLAIAFVAILVLVQYALPSLIDLLDDFGGRLPFATRLLISITDFSQTYAAYLLFGTIGFAVLAAAYMRTRQGIRVRDTLLLRIPVVKRVLMMSNMFVLSSTLVTMLEAGVPPIEALRLTSEGLNNVLLRDAVENVRQMASEGTRLGEAFGTESIFPTVLAQGISVGELRGTQSDTLHGLATYFEQETDRVVAAATELIQPAIILVVAVIVGFVAVAVISGIYSTLESIE